MKLAIVGSRTLRQKEVLQVIGQVITKAKNKIDTVITGGANGVDSIAEYYAKNHNIGVEVYYPVYSRHGKRAPLIRNNEIIKNSNAMLAIWDGESKGTKYTTDKAKKAGMAVMVVRLDPIKKYNDNIWNFPHQGRSPKNIEIKKRVS